MSEYVVTTTSGKVQGYERNGLAEYLGIPYAMPPVGELRFKRAQAVIPRTRFAGTERCRASNCRIPACTRGLT